MDIVFNLFIYFGILFSFGWFFSRNYLKEKELINLVALSILLSTAAYVFLLNIISYFIPIKISFWLVLGILVLATLFLLVFYRKKTLLPIEISFSKKWLWIITLTFFLISFSSLIIGLRSIESDTLYVIHIPLASTIAEGNFPVLNPHNPTQLYIYHYAPELFSAAINKITKTSIDFAYDIQIGIAAGLIFLLSFILSFRLTKKTLPSYLASILILFGGGLNFLNIFNGLPGLYNKFVLGNQVAAPFEFLNHAIFGEFVYSLATFIHNHSVAIGFPIILGALYFYIKSLYDNKWIKSLIITGLLFGFLALSMETYFPVLMVIFLIYPFGLLLFKQKEQLKRSIIVSLSVLFLGLLIAIYQGGVFTAFLNFEKGGTGVSLGFYAILTFLNRIPNFSSGLSVIWIFLREFGICFVLLIPALIYFRKNKDILILLGLAAIVPFFVPFVVMYDNALNVIEYYFNSSFLFMCLIVGLYLGMWILKSISAKKKAMIVFLTSLVFVIILNGLMFQLVFMFYPMGHLKKGPNPFLAKIPAMSKLDVRADQWIQKNTTIDDLFFAIKENGSWKSPEYPLNDTFFKTNSDFITKHRRFVLTFYQTLLQHPSEDNISKYEKIKQECRREEIDHFEIDYLYVDFQWPKGLEEKCLANNLLELVHRDKDANDFRRIYRVANK